MVSTRQHLVVDLDGTLVRTDLLMESVVALLRRQPFWLFVLPFWLLRGKAGFKHEVARRADLEMSTLPWRADVIEQLRGERAEGRSLVLATGSDIRIAHAVADYLNLFDMVFASHGSVNLTGQTKRELLVKEFGESGFEYIDERSRAVRGSFFKALRPAHWLKNLLVFVPLLAAHRIDEPRLVGRFLLAFLAFGCCASSGYLFNDLIDLEADRRHPQKRLRPFASGDLPLVYGLAGVPILLIAGCAIGALVSPLVAAIVLIYFAMSAAYSLHLKHVAILDVLFLAGLYTVRTLAGSAAGLIWPSHWLLAFTIFLFFSLALVKRYGELVIMRRVDGGAAKARGYELSDSELLAAMGVASGYLAVLVLALYIATDKARELYSTRELLWLLCPLLLYWISYVWLNAHRGKMPGDPVLFAIHNRTSCILLLSMMATAAVAL